MGCQSRDGCLSDEPAGSKNRNKLRVQGHPARSSLTTSPRGRAVWSPTMELLKAASMAEKREALETGRLSRGWFSGRLSTEKDKSAARNRSALTALEPGAARAAVCRSLVAHKSCPGSATASAQEARRPVKYKCARLTCETFPQRAPTRGSLGKCQSCPSSSRALHP